METSVHDPAVIAHGERAKSTVIRSIATGTGDRSVSGLRENLTHRTIGLQICITGEQAQMFHLSLRH